MSELSTAELSRQIQAAMKSKDAELLSTLRMLSAALRNAEVEKGGPLSEDEGLALVAREAKRREETAGEFERAGRSDRADAERREAAILRRWLPEQMSKEEVAALVDEAVAESGASTPADMGKVMKVLMPKVRGRADGKMVSDLVKERLSG